jgi:hypothetical protein
MGGCISQKPKKANTEQLMYKRILTPDMIYFKSDAFLLYVATSLHSCNIVTMNKLKKSLPSRSIFYHFKDHKIFSAGGLDRSSQEECTTVYIATVNDNRIEFKASLPYPIYSGVIHFHKGRLILSGGSLNHVKIIEEAATFPFPTPAAYEPRWDVSIGMTPAPLYQYLLSSETWEEVQTSCEATAPPIEPSHILSPATCILNGKMFLIGGVTADSSGEILNNHYIIQYDLETKVYKIRPIRFNGPMSISMKCVAIDEKRILILGGYCIASGEKLVSRKVFMYHVGKSVDELPQLEWDLDLTDRIAPYVSNGFAVFFAFPRVLLYDIDAGKFSLFDFRDRFEEEKKEVKREGGLSMKDYLKAQVDMSDETGPKTKEKQQNIGHPGDKSKQTSKHRDNRM